LLLRTASPKTGRLRHVFEFRDLRISKDVGGDLSKLAGVQLWSAASSTGSRRSKQKSSPSVWALRCSLTHSRGHPPVFQLDGPGDQFSRCPVAREPNYNGIFNVPNPDGYLRTCMTAEVHIVPGTANGVPTLPAAALRQAEPNGTFKVRVVEPSGAVSTRVVKVGLNKKVVAEIRDGLAAGERVVIGTTGMDSSARKLPGPPPGM
jgi:hypothetical protein